MRDLLTDLEAGQRLSDPDPVRRAQIQMRTPLPKRFYKEVGTAPSPHGGHFILLDGKAVRTPAMKPLVMPTSSAARLVADEFELQREVIDPVSMPVLRLANTAAEGVAGRVGQVLDDIVAYAGSDMICYRAESPEELVRRQAAAWNPWLEWARTYVGARLWLAEGVMHVDQPAEALASIRDYIASRAEPFRLAALHLMTTLSGSAILALAVEAGSLDPRDAWQAAHVDEDWNIEKWGRDAEAVARRSAREADMMAAARLLAALDDAAEQQSE